LKGDVCLKFGTISIAAMLVIIGLMSAMPMASAEESATDESYTLTAYFVDQKALLQNIVNLLDVDIHAGNMQPDRKIGGGYTEIPRVGKVYYEYGTAHMECWAYVNGIGTTYDVPAYYARVSMQHIALLDAIAIFTEQPSLAITDSSSDTETSATSVSILKIVEEALDIDIHVGDVEKDHEMGSGEMDTGSGTLYYQYGTAHIDYSVDTGSSVGGGRIPAAYVNSQYKPDPWPYYLIMLTHESN
jgi:hypothetical protein